MMNESDILYQNGDYWVCKAKKKGYEVLRDTITHAEVIMIIGSNEDEWLKRAIYECDKRAINKGGISNENIKI